MCIRDRYDTNSKLAKIRIRQITCSGIVGNNFVLVVEWSTCSCFFFTDHRETLSGLFYTKQTEQWVHDRIAISYNVDVHLIRACYVVAIKTMEHRVTINVC